MIKKIKYHSRKPFLFDKENTTMKKGRGLLDLTMETYDGVEVCKLVGTFSFKKISKICN